MVDVLRYVNANPGCTNQVAACAVGPNGSHAYGDRTVKRCWRRGLIYNIKAGDPHARACAWVLTAAGRIELEADEVRSEDIRAFRTEARKAGDDRQAELCSLALAGAVDGPNWQACARIIATVRLA